MRALLEKTFKLKEHNTNILTEVIGGVTTFFAMAYIIFVNPSFLTQSGMDRTAVMLATCISAGIGTILTAFLANVPFAQAPGMGLNAFFTYTICLGMGYTWQQGLAIVFISGLIFLFITVSPLRGAIISALPASLKNAISAGVGLFICLIGLLNTGIVTADGNLLDLGAITSGTPLLAIIGIVITGVLMAWKVKGALFIGIILTTIIGIPMGQTDLSGLSFSLEGLSMAPTFMKLSFNGLLSLGVMPLVTAIVTFTMCDCFDTLGTLIGTAANAGMLDKDGNLPRGDKALIADAIATCLGALFGTSTVSTLCESATGISEGARTGLASLVTGVLFLLACVLAPLAGIIPSAATAPALVVVGMLMIASVTTINWKDVEEALPCFLTIALMPFTYSIADGLGFGIISYVLIKVCRGKFRQVPVLMYILALLFVGMYVLSSL